MLIQSVRQRQTKSWLLNFLKLNILCFCNVFLALNAIVRLRLYFVKVLFVACDNSMMIINGSVLEW